ncbi:MAG: rhodanese-like domain-containing protein [Lewinella sp.]|nr:rhodanese-like domain-containing protein [Anaerolineae bacterium]MCB0639070.1 rhodanese-like domain-containing protein [Lewinella sp.]
MELTKIFQEGKYTLVDVREPIEFSMGNAPGAINIPLGQVPTQVQRFRDMPKPLLLHCRSGARSGQAAAFLQAQGVKDVYNVGGLDQVMYYVSTAVAQR